MMTIEQQKELEYLLELGFEKEIALTIVLDFDNTTTAIRKEEN